MISIASRLPQLFIFRQEHQSLSRSRTPFSFSPETSISVSNPATAESQLATSFFMIMTWVDPHPFAKSSCEAACVAEAAQLRDLADGVATAANQGKALRDPVFLQILRDGFPCHPAKAPAAGLS